MEQITLQGALPRVFRASFPGDSDIWNNDVSFSRGRLYLVEAASGKGKTSFCSYVYGSRDDYDGSILFDDQAIPRLSPGAWGEIRRSSLGMVFQGLRLFPELTAVENVCLKNRLTAFRDEAWIRAAFERLDIADKMDAPVAKISFGQQQRVALIRALCQPLDFLLLDEPVSHLDEENCRRAGELLREEAALHGFGIISTSIGKHVPLPYHGTFHL
ncbi:MAG: ATP-binding cassette domain-containing protein [Odoribacteraceae bacterium]|jgi:ABC-type lipoprotein export system ATPase subunit|nr:ATP-binding cassette domain-containing protein [Odoribacteraceae bacterium]